MKPFEQKALDYFGEIVINKSLIHKAGFGSRAIPTYVGEWIIANFVGDETSLSNLDREKISNFVNKYVPEKGQKETVKNKLYEQEQVKILDNFSVYVNLVKGDRYLKIPFLDENSARISPKIVENNEMLLSSGLWGVGSLIYLPKSDDNPKGQIWMQDFQPFQLANVDTEYFSVTRSEFIIDEWINLIISSMGFNHELYNDRQKLLLICRLIPMVEPRYNLVEPAPKGTGKSFVYDNMSRYVTVRSGKISPAVLFFNDSRKTPGLITRYDSVVIDEAQKVKADSSGELTALLKSYLESGKFGRGTASEITAEAGIVLLANIEMDNTRQPINRDIGLFRDFPNFLQEPAFIDRLSGLLPGWFLPRISNDTPSKDLGLKGDVFGELLHTLRSDISFRDYVKTEMVLPNCDDMRDTKAIESGASGLLKILFPDKAPTEEEFYKYCVNPAVELRQRVKDELCKTDQEYEPGTIKSEYPDYWQINHKLPVYHEIDDEGNIKTKEPESEEKTNIKDGKLDTYREPTIDTITIEDNESGYSYKNLFYPYIKNADKITIVDPYLRYDYQIRNFINFCEMLAPSEGNIKLHLKTKTDGQEEKKHLTTIYEEMQNNLIKHRIKFTFEFDDSVHDRSIKTDNNWFIKLGRGLDIFKKPDTKYGLGSISQIKRKCKSTEISYNKL